MATRTPAQRGASLTVQLLRYLTTPPRPTPRAQTLRRRVVRERVRRLLALKRSGTEAAWYETLLTPEEVAGCEALAQAETTVERLTVLQQLVGPP
jgi:hypothetical protein